MSASPPGTTNLCAVLYEKNDLRLEQRESTDLQPKKGEVLIAIRSVGICGSDVHFLKEGRIGSFGLPSPTVLGHEASGIVIAVGEDVTALQLGDRVAIEPGITCRQCFYCKSGRYNLCPHVVFGSAPPFDGYLTNYKTHPADLCYKYTTCISLCNCPF
jgi:L-iditol 2-dehydrogenase